MDPALADRLNEINRSFYGRFAAAFAESRSLEQSGLHRLRDHIPVGSRVLDVGCGPGRFALLLERWSESFPVHGAGPESAQPVNATTYTYLGLDSSSQLIELAIQRTAHLERVAADLLVADLLAPAWRDAVSGRKFDVILLLAVLHHVPGFDNRLALMRALAEHLDHGGKLVVSVWQFADHPRMRRKIVSWDNVGVQPAGLEPGDYLLDWKRGGTGYRYCHQVDMAELNRLAGAAGLELLETFRADGKEGNLSLYGVMNAAT